jgi:hypothetical protein
VIEVLLNERTGFIHGEFYSSNVLVQRRDCSAGATLFMVRPVDWEMAALGPPLVDLACLLAGRWTDAERADVADTYFLELAGLGGDVSPRGNYLKTLDCCLIHLSVRNLGWSNAWTPPAVRAHDWLGEAVRLCEKWQL